MKKISRLFSNFIFCIILLVGCGGDNGTGTDSTLEITSISPQTGSAGTRVIIKGSGFSSAISENTVLFNGTTAQVSSAMSRQLETAVPHGATSGPIEVTVAGQTATGPDFTIVLEASFEGLGDLPGGDVFSEANGVSDDGSVVVGTSSSDSASGSYTEAFRWKDGEMIGLGDLPGGAFDSEAFGVSADGSVVVGKSRSEEGLNGEAFYWINGEMVGLGGLPGGNFRSGAHGVSSDGSIIVGNSLVGTSDREAFSWTDAGEMAGLGDLSGGVYVSYAYAVSDDGSVIVGKSSSSSNSNGSYTNEAFRWTSEDGMVGLGDLSGGVNSKANDVSSDGSVLVGRAASENGSEAFRWENESMEGLSNLPGGTFGSATSVSADGGIVVGWSDSENGIQAFIWTSGTGIQNLKTLLEEDYGLDLSGWSLTEATSISADGLVIVGNGINPDGNDEAWRISLESPAEKRLKFLMTKKGDFNYGS